MGKPSASPIETRLRDAIVVAAPHAGVAVYDYTWSPFAFELERGIDARLDLLCPEVDDDASVHPLADIETHGGRVTPPRGDRGLSLALFAQVRVGGYFADLLIAAHVRGMPWMPWIAVECDGHDWHERTKQQAAYDRARDRALLIMGVPTIRFTGSEIHHDAHRCATSAIECATAWLQALHQEADEAAVAAILAMREVEART